MNASMHESFYTMWLIHQGLNKDSPFDKLRQILIKCRFDVTPCPPWFYLNPSHNSLVNKVAVLCSSSLVRVLSTLPVVYVLITRFLTLMENGRLGTTALSNRYTVLSSIMKISLRVKIWHTIKSHFYVDMGQYVGHM